MPTLFDPLCFRYYLMRSARVGNVVLKEATLLLDRVEAHAMLFVAVVRAASHYTFHKDQTHAHQLALKACY
jgi:hypothetical protein